MVAIEPAEVFANEEYRTLFHRYITRSIDALYRRVAAGLEELSADTLEQVWHLLDYGLKLGHAWEGVGRLLLALAPQMERGGFRHEWLPYLESGVTCSHRVQDLSGEAQLSLYIGRLYRLRGELVKARTWLMASATLCRQLADRRGRGLALNQLGYVARLQSRYAEAQAFVDEALRLLDEHDTERATSLWVLGSVAQDQLAWSEAEGHHRAALQIWQQAGNQQRTAWTLQNLGETLRAAGRYSEAAAYIQQAIVLLGQLHDPVNQAIARMSMGIVHIEQGEPREALALYTLAEAVFRQVGDQIHLAMTYNNLTIVYRMSEEWPAAIQSAEKGVRLWEAMGEVKNLANTLDELGLAYQGHACYAEAIRAFERGLELLAQLPSDPFTEMLQDMMRPHLEEARQLGSA